MQFYAKNNSSRTIIRVDYIFKLKKYPLLVMFMVNNFNSEKNLKKVQNVT